VDIVGPFTGYNDNTLFASSLLYASTWIVIGTAKLSMTSTKVVQLLKETIYFMENGIPLEEVQKTTWQKFLEIPMKVVNSCKKQFSIKSKKE
jgi:hypothetical protein